ncbi:MAG: lytic transglycosylase domain-containing protein [Magnetospirillum sp.]|nr:MAG: lytic transglycosylase domain-containing protein [Magnetospirillum sp.]
MQTPAAEIIRSEPPEPAKGGKVVSGIREAATRTGVSFDYLLAQATQESGLDPHARNTKSTAAGLFQFTAPTWIEMVKRHGAEHGLAAEAAAITKGGDGKLEIADKAARKVILDLRKDPRLSSLMAAEYAKDNAQVLERRLGRAATASDLYLAHFLGAGGAARVIEGAEDTPRRSAQRLLPEAARANPDVFHEPGSRKARTVAGLYKSVQARFQNIMGGDDDAAGQPALTGRPDLAALRPQPRPEPAVTTAMATIETPTAKAVAAVAAAVVPAATKTAAINAYAANAFANAIQPDSPFFPAAIPPSPSMAGQGGKADNLTLRAVIDSMDSGKDV